MVEQNHLLWLAAQHVLDLQNSATVLLIAEDNRGTIAKYSYGRD
jgi:hypothetical protein